MLVALRDEKFNMKSELWFGYLREDDGTGTIVVFDHDMPDLINDEVYLFNARIDKILPYVKDDVRPKLSPLKNLEKSRLESIKYAFRKARLRLLSEIEKHGREFYFFYDNDDEPYIYTENLSQQIDTTDELKMYSEMLTESREEGWFYSDYDGTLKDNMVGPG